MSLYVDMFHRLAGRQYTAHQNWKKSDLIPFSNKMYAMMLGVLQNGIYIAEEVCITSVIKL
jgi:hypothetical protein